MAAEISKRKYELRKRAAAMTDTRRRITEAAVELHGSVGPARTTVSAVAARAGVQRHTVYRHFPTDEDLFAACSAHFAELHPFPDIGALRGEADPPARLEAALNELYDHYAETAYIWSNILRDVELVPAIPKAMAPFERQLDELVRLLASGWGARGGRRALLTAAIRHAIDFRTWESLVQRGGISASQGARLMRALVEDALRPPPPKAPP
jgi:AcrR family transcriptional regulator